MRKGGARKRAEDFLQKKIGATPDGRLSGSALKFGLGQSEGKDRNGLTALLNSIAKADPNAIGCGSTVTNVTLDSALVKEDENFEKTVKLLKPILKTAEFTFSLRMFQRRIY